MDQIRAGIFSTSPSFGGLEMNTIRLIEWMWCYEAVDIPALFLQNSPLAKAASDKNFNAVLFQNSGIFGRLRQLNDWVKRGRLNILIVPHNTDLKIAALYKRYINPRVKLVYQQHMQVGIAKRDPVHTRRYNMIDAWVAPLQYLKIETLEKTRVPAERIHVIPFGIEPEPLMKRELSLATSRDLLGLPQDVLLIGSLGRLDPKKGQDTLIRALKQLHSELDIRAHLLLMGNATLNEGDAYARSIHALIEGYGLQDYIHLRPYHDDVAAFFHTLDIFAMPSHNETYGMVTLEAMAAGVPVIGTAAGGTVEILEAGELGYLFEPQNAKDFVRAFTELTSDMNSAAKMEAAQNTVHAKYTAQQMCRSIRTLLSGFAV